MSRTHTSKAAAAPKDLAKPVTVNMEAVRTGTPPDLGGDLSVRLTNHEREDIMKSPDFPLNVVIRYQAEAAGFKAYQSYIDDLMAELAKQDAHTASPFFDGLRRSLSPESSSTGSPVIKLYGTLAYEVLRLATEAFLLTRCGPTCKDFRSHEMQVADFKAMAESDAQTLGFEDDVQYREKLLEYLSQMAPGNAGATPYLKIIVNQLELNRPQADPLTLRYASRYECPLMIELIWSYWHEEGMLSQTMAAIGIRFQNRRSRPGPDPLVSLETDVLRPLNNLLWGWIQSEYQRLSVQRRAYEYDHHYGLTLMGKAVPPLLSADSRSKFLESFHTLLNVAHKYYEDASNTTLIPDGFPLLNALRGTHLVLAEGAHNQYGDLPWTARVEMLIEQWLLSRQEMREFLRSRPMVPYQESWMGQVDVMKRLQGWSDVPVTHYHELATCGENILLSVRHGPWASSNNQSDAKAWASYWRPEIQRYIYAYKAVTGVDLSLDPPDNSLPARLIAERVGQQRLAHAGTR